MRELRVTAGNFSSVDTSDDCFLPPDDPIHAIKSAGMLGTLTSHALDQAYASKRRQDIADEHFKLRDEAKRQGIRPGTPAWFALTQR